MPTGQSNVKVDQDLKAGVGEEAVYLLIGHSPCRTKRAFKVTENLHKIMDGDSEGFAIATQCETCKSMVLVQLFKAKDLAAEWSYGLPIQADGGVTVRDDNGLKPDPDAKPKES